MMPHIPPWSVDENRLYALRSDDAASAANAGLDVQMTVGVAEDQTLQGDRVRKGFIDCQRFYA
jgi:hypothetical protein